MYYTMKDTFTTLCCKYINVVNIKHKLVNSLHVNIYCLYHNDIKMQSNGILVEIRLNK